MASSTAAAVTALPATLTTLHTKWRIFIYAAAPWALLSVLCRIALETAYGALTFGWVDMPIAAVFLSSSMFVLALMMNGVILDFKEGEKLSGAISSALEGLSEAVEHGVRSKEIDGAPHRAALLELATAVVMMFGRFTSEDAVLDSLTGTVLGIGVALDSAGVGAPLIARAYAEMQALRAAVSRVQIIARTTYIAEGYALVDLLVVFNSALLVVGRYANSETCYVTIGFFAMLFSYLRVFIRKLDNPFDYPPEAIERILRGEYGSMLSVSAAQQQQTTVTRGRYGSVPSFGGPPQTQQRPVLWGDGGSGSGRATEGPMRLSDKEASGAGVGVGAPLLQPGPGGSMQQDLRPTAGAERLPRLEVITTATEVSIAPIVHQLWRLRAAVHRDQDGVRTAKAENACPDPSRSGARAARLVSHTTETT